MTNARHASELDAGGGIVGTPLESGTGFRVTAADRMAPTRAVYERMRDRKRVASERALLEDAALASGLGGRGGAGDLMDDEDRANARLAAVRRRARPVAGDSVDFLPFEMAATEFPEVVPVRDRVSVGYAILRAGARRDDVADAAARQKYRLGDFTAAAEAAKSDRFGLGYEDMGDGPVDALGKRAETASRAVVVAGHNLEKKEGYRQVGLGVVGDDEDDEGVYDAPRCEGDSDGEGGLDAAAERLQLALLRQRKKASGCTVGQGNIGKTSSSSKQPLFASFGPPAVLFTRPDSVGETTEQAAALSIPPPEFSRNPVHDFKRDRFPARAVADLPDGIGMELEQVAQAEMHRLALNGKAVLASADLAAKHSAKSLERVRAAFLRDMKSSFVKASPLDATGAATDAIGAANADGADIENASGQLSNKNPSSQKGQSALIVRTVGDSLRQVGSWQPAALLCKRYGVPQPVIEEAQSFRPGPASASGPSMSRDGDDASSDDGFQITAILDAKGHKLNLESAHVVLVEDTDFIVPGVEEGNESGEDEAGQQTALPSQEVYRALFGDSERESPEQERRGAANGSVEPTVEKSSAGPASASGTQLLLGRPRASDFF